MFADAQVMSTLLLTTLLCACSANTDNQAEIGNDICAKTAAARAHDAAYNGYDSAMQQKIYAETYKDCLAWKDRATVIVIPPPRH
jgi:hypothetical protein